MRRHALAVVAVLLVATSVTSCGGDGGGASSDTVAPFTTASPEAFERWRAATEKVCKKYAPELVGILEQFGFATTVDELIRLIDALTPVNNRVVHALVSIEVPDRRRRLIERTHDVLKRNQRSLADTRVALANSAPGEAQLLGQRTIDETRELAALYEELGVRACLAQV